MTDFVVSQQLQTKELKLKKTRKRVPQPPQTFRKLAILLYKINLFQDCFFVGYELISIPNREMYSLSVIILLLLSTATFGLILFWIKVEDKLTIFTSSTGELINPRLAFGCLAILPMLIIPAFNPSVLSEVVKHGIYASSSTIVVFCFSFESKQNLQIFLDILQLLNVGLFTGWLFQAVLG